MGGSCKPDVGAFAEANQLKVFGMDDLNRSFREAYIQENPQHRNPSNKNYLFMLEFSKYRSKIRDLIKEKKDYLDKLSPLIESVVDKAGKFDVSTRAQLTQELRSQMIEVGEEFSVVQEQLTNEKYENLNRRLRFTTKRCCTMVERVRRQMKLIDSPEKNPAWKRIQNPELDMEKPAILLLIYLGSMAKNVVDLVFSAGDKLHFDFLKEYTKHMWRVVEFDRQAFKNITKKRRALQRKARQDPEEVEPKRRRTE